MARMPYLPGVEGFSSTFILTMDTLPSYSVASSSMTGPKARQGPHQGAQKSTRTGREDWRTSLSNELSVTAEGIQISLSTALIQRQNNKFFRENSVRPLCCQAVLSVGTGSFWRDTLLGSFFVRVEYHKSTLPQQKIRLPRLTPNCIQYLIAQTETVPIRWWWVSCRDIVSDSVFPSGRGPKSPLPARKICLPHLTTNSLNSTDPLPIRYLRAN